jgi:3-isopropylmalate dehydrogenase
MDIVVLPGDGIGPEITEATLTVLTKLNSQDQLGLNVDRQEVGLLSLQRDGITLPEEVRRRVEAASGFILGPLSTYEYPPAAAGGLNPSAEFRTRLGLFANVRPSLNRPRRKNVMDIVLVRENTEGFYASRSMYAGSGEFMPDPDSAFSFRKITRSASARVAKVAFEMARRRRRKVSVIHKANVLKVSDGLFLEAVRSVADDYTDVELEELLVDAAAALLVREPSRFDVMLTTNMFGDILSNEAAELSGGLGMAPSLNIGMRSAMAQACHGSAPDIAGINRANPTGLMLSVAMLLEWLGPTAQRPDVARAGRRLRDAVDQTLENPATRTRDLQGPLGTREFGEAVAANL